MFVLIKGPIKIRVGAGWLVSPLSQSLSPTIPSYLLDWTVCVWQGVGREDPRESRSERAYETIKRIQHPLPPGALNVFWPLCLTPAPSPHLRGRLLSLLADRPWLQNCLPLLAFA